MIIDIITIFPKMFSPVLGESIIKRAQNKGLVKINLCDLRDYSSDPHKKIDAPSYGGGGMVFRTQPLFSAVEAILGDNVYPPKESFSTKMKNYKRGNRRVKEEHRKIVLFSPQGKTLNQKLIKKFLKCERLILLAPRYEGVDERVRRYLADEEISIGDYVLSGAELAAMVFIDCLVRLIPGVVSHPESIKKESFETALLDYPHYTRPRVFRGLETPDILFSGDHKKIEEWRKKQAQETTKRKRPDLLKS